MTLMHVPRIMQRGGADHAKDIDNQPILTTLPSHTTLHSLTLFFPVILIKVTGFCQESLKWEITEIGNNCQNWDSQV